MKHKNRPATMVAPKPEPAETLHPVTELAALSGLSSAHVAGLCRAKGWSEGKQVTTAEFTGAMDAFENRPMGGGRI
ncbi:MAG: hypothetical protein PHY09_16735 [Desulfuromonadaceae bacterium]|nr:hypothetical protein [Desulfuromonadaceae bacterium]MDD5107561.1 hypothetical protein [Desulfuromonadaceae bacterium]